ncbi:MAG TPA: PDZ domain-containing protein [Microthrixaceae bacterium]|nr:PDZ domain-containing protein [Microthrixaceae bacterium]
MSDGPDPELDPGSESDPEGEFDTEPFRAPLPPQDRLWMHPSELRSQAASSQPAQAGSIPSADVDSTAASVARRRGRQAVAVGLVALASVTITIITVGESLELPRGTSLASSEASLMSTATSSTVPARVIASWIGIVVVDDGSGVTITRCAAKSRAAAAGLAAGDVITRVGGVVVRRRADLVAALSTLRYRGETQRRVTIEVERGGRTVEVVVPLKNAVAVGS